MTGPKNRLFYYDSTIFVILFFTNILKPEKDSDCCFLMRYFVKINSVNLLPDRGVGSISILGPRVLKIMQYHIVSK